MLALFGLFTCERILIGVHRHYTWAKNGRIGSYRIEKKKNEVKHTEEKEVSRARREIESEQGKHRATILSHHVI